MVTGGFPYRDRALNFGHRGAPIAAPENTLASFQQAREMGADGIELDVMLCADGDVVVSHDYTVERTTDGEGRIADLPLSQLKTLDAGAWFSPQFAGERVPTLREVLAWAGEDILLNIELKSLRLGTDGLEKKVVSLVREHRMQHTVVLSSFNPFALRRVRQMAPELHTGLLYAAGLPVYLRRAWLRPLALVNALHPQFEMVNEAYMAWARRSVYRVNVWCPTETLEMQRLVRLGVDMIITDRPDLLTNVLRDGEPRADPRRGKRNGKRTPLGAISPQHH
jgi:glycerophosphoryl diester phosphodiesterase